MSRPNGTPLGTLLRGYNFVINPCNTIVCNSSSNSTGGVCINITLAGINTVISGGQANGQLIEENGVLALHYTNGDRCPGGAFASSIITFICNAQQQAPQLLSSDVVNCRFKFLWKTPLACPDLVSNIPCRVGDYDLTPLINNNANWWATDARENGKYVYQMNVCRTLVQNNVTNCTAGMAACQTTPYDPTVGDFDLGRLLTPPSVDSHGNLYIRYTSGQFCNNTYARSTIINFQCPRDTYGNAIPGYIGHPNFNYQGTQCDYFFTWTTSFACPLTAFSGSSCQVTDTSRGILYNLALLTDTSGNYIIQAGTLKFVLNVCLNIQGNACGPNSANIGACVIDTTTNSVTSLGVPTASPTIDGGSLLLKYTSGAPCASNPSFLRSTTFEFICDPNSPPGTSKPVLIEQNGCSYIFQWATSIACAAPQVVECLVLDKVNNVYYDLSVLADPYENWKANQQLASGSSFSYDINVCRSIVPDTNFPGCPTSAAACKIATSPSGFSFVESSIGQVAAPALASDGNHVYVQYSNGAPCPSAPGTNSSTRIDFYCPRTSGASQTGPIFLAETSQCQYLFSWTTRAACAIPLNATTTTTAPGLLTCQTYDPINNFAYNLNPMAATNISANIFHISGFDPNTIIVMQMCNASSFGYAITMVSPQGTVTNLGIYTQNPTVSDGDLSITFTNGSSCSSGSIQSSVTLLCDPTQGVGFANFLGTDVTGCIYQFEWHTKYACRPEQTIVPCALTDPQTGKLYDLSPLMMFVLILAK